MTNNPAGLSGRLKTKDTAAVAEALYSLGQNNQVAGAREIFYRYREIKPDDLEMTMLYTDILLNADRLDEAERLLEDELNKNPGCFALLFRLGRLEEVRCDFINAFDFYRRSRFHADTLGEKKEAQAALAQVKEHINSELHFKENAYLIKLKGNRKPLNLQYSVKEQLRRKALLEAISKAIDPGAKTVLEIECDTGLITRSLAARGFKTEGVSKEMSDIVLAMGFEYVEMLHKAEKMVLGGYRCLDLDAAAVEALEKKDVILLLPARLQWYADRQAEGTAKLIAALFKKARRQLLFYLPPGEGEGEAKEMARAVTHCLKEQGILRTEPVFLNITGESGLIYRLDQRRARPGDLSKVVPVGLEVTGSRSFVFEVEVKRCRSLNGFGFTEAGWNHFRAFLEEMQSCPGLKYKDSILKLFYERFQPKSRQDQLFGEVNTPLPPLERGWAILPWVETKNRHLSPVESPHSRPGGNHQYGPNSEEFGREQCRRLLANYTLIKRHGYIPEIFPDGYIQGYLLKDGADYRFYVNEGQHRMAAVGLLGYDKIRVKFNPDFLPVVDIAKIKKWPQVKSGLYSKEVAEKVFYYYFEEDGRRKAGELGLQ